MLGGVLGEFNLARLRLVSLTGSPCGRELAVGSVAGASLRVRPYFRRCWAGLGQPAGCPYDLRPYSFFTLIVSALVVLDVARMHCMYVRLRSPLPLHKLEKS